VSCRIRAPASSSSVRVVRRRSHVRAHLRLPVHARHVCHLKTGDRLLLAALVDARLLLVFTKAALDAMVLTQFTAEADLERPQ